MTTKKKLTKAEFYAARNARYKGELPIVCDYKEEDKPKCDTECNSYMAFVDHREKVHFIKRGLPDSFQLTKGNPNYRQARARTTLAGGGS